MILFLIVIVLLFVFGFHSGNIGEFDKSSVVVLKPIMALCIILHHLHSESIYLYEMERWGSIMVGMFFFISGYGLEYSIQKRDTYLKNFWYDKILVKLVLPSILALTLYLSVNRLWQVYDLKSHLFNLDGPSLFPNDWFVYALIWCYVIFLLGGKFKRYYLRFAMLIIGPLALVVFALNYGWARNWWATPMAFSVGILYRYYETKKRILHGDHGHIYINLICVIVFGILMLCSMVFGSSVSTMMAYSLLPIWIVSNLTHIHLSKLADNNIIIYLSKISFDVYLIHGIVVSYLKDVTSLSGCGLIISVIGVTFITAAIFNKINIFFQKQAQILKVIVSTRLNLLQN